MVAITSCEISSASCSTSDNHNDDDVVVGDKNDPSRDGSIALDDWSVNGTTAAARAKLLRGHGIVPMECSLLVLTLRASVGSMFRFLGLL
jgi:hypothetical protein